MPRSTPRKPSCSILRTAAARPALPPADCSCCHRSVSPSARATPGGTWLCHHLWERWLFTRDRDFLANRAYPALREASLFFVDYLVRDEKTGRLLTSHSHSPEQGPTTAGPTMDNQLIRFLWTATIAAARELNQDAEFAAQLEGLLPKIPPSLIGKHGQLQEWLTDDDVPDNSHRHMSPLWALYPGAACAGT